MPWSDIDLIIMKKDEGKHQTQSKVRNDVLAHLEDKLRVAYRKVSNLRNRQMPLQRFTSSKGLRFQFSKS